MLIPRQFRLLSVIIAAVLALALAGCASSAATPIPSPEPSPEPTVPPPATATASPSAVTLGADCEDPFAGEQVSFPTSYWEDTDFCERSVRFSTIQWGGVSKDGIPAIDEPLFEDQSGGDEWLGPQWPVVVFENDDEARAYPLAILIWHEIVNDTVGGQPVTVTFCPLCNSTIAFDRTAPDGRVLDFGTTGNLRHSDLIMYDRQTESWWQQITGEAIVGEYTGAVLELLPSQILAWQDFKGEYPQGQVLSREIPNPRRYGENPYGGYDSNPDSQPFLFTGFPDDRLPAKERVVAVQLDGQSVAYPFSHLSEVRVINDHVGDEPVVVFWQSGVNSSLDSGNLANSRDVGTAAVYVRTVDGQTLSFESGGDQRFRDRETGSAWTLLGEAVDGPLAGTQLEKVIHGQHFWFAWAAFMSETEVRTP